MKKYLTFGLVALALSACTNEEEMPVNGSDTINLISTVQALSTRANSLTQQSTEIVNGQKVGAWLTDADTEEAFYSNVQLEAGDEGALTPAAQLMWGARTTAKAVAYHPYNAGWTLEAENSFSVSIDQSSDADYLSSDLLYAPVKTGAKSDPSISLEFYHALAKINVTLTTDDVNLDLTGATVNIVGTKVSATFKPSDGIVGAATGETATIKAAVTTAQAKTASAIVVPQTVNGKLVEVLYNGKKYYYSLPAEKELKARHSYSYTLKLTESPDMNAKLTLVNGQINEWTDEENEEPAYSDEEAVMPEVGNYYFSDGTFSSTFGNNCVGIIFAVNGNVGKVVSLDQVNFNWSTEQIEVGCDDINNGIANTNKIKALDSFSETTYPAAYWCISKPALNGNTWYLPAIEEVKSIYTNRNAINTAIEATTGTPLTPNGYYLSSTELLGYEATDAMDVHFETGETKNCAKDGCDWAYTRAVLAFTIQ